MKKWILQPEADKKFLDSHPELPAIISTLLWNRGLKTQKEIDEFLNPDYSENIHDPFLFHDMSKALKIIFKAIEKQKNIVIHGDYDADGVCSAVLIYNTLKKLNAKNVDIFLPHRETDGYGLNSNTIELLKEKNTDLIITCDCGISNAEEIKLAKKYGMEVIITDHHTVPEKLPKADAIIHPKVPGEKYPDKTLAGGGVAFKLIQGILKKHAENNENLPDGEPHEAFEKWMLDLAAIATIGDMVPLIGESRTMARYGLTVLNKTRNLGLQKLLQISGVSDGNGKPKKGNYDVTTVGFKIVPRINAAGRMDHANTAYKLLISENDAEAEKLSQELNKNNIDRRKLTDDILKQAKKQIEETGTKDNLVIFVLGEDWPTGILGLVAGRLKDQFYKPAIVMSKTASGEIVGSGRSIEEFNIIKNLQILEDLFIKYGGHPQACGFSIKEKNLEKFKTEFELKAKEDLKDTEKLVPQIKIDTKVDLEDVNWKLYDLLQKFEPFGMSNEEPKYVAYGLEVVAIEPVGQDGKHLKLMVKHNSHVVKKTIGFWFGDSNKHPYDWKTNLKPGEKIDMVFSIGVNEWNGNRELELKIEDLNHVK